ncbi:putative WW domain-containing oxidoreductase [Seiridium unicorne]|uniref:WW domain-containing oxidoreductase n=1 Tax=Seiridium unicorne TaxID=138068 RepID=A0ABR2V5B6_9PEZI
MVQRSPPTPLLRDSAPPAAQQVYIIREVLYPRCAHQDWKNCGAITPPTWATAVCSASVKAVPVVSTTGRLAEQWAPVESLLANDKPVLLLIWPVLFSTFRLELHVDMDCTGLLTRANGSAGLYTAEHAESASRCTFILTAMNASESYSNTQRLRETVGRYLGAKASIHRLDLADLKAVYESARKVLSEVAAGEYPPLKSIIGNAHYWSLGADSKPRTDDYDKTLEVSLIFHVALVLCIIGIFTNEGHTVLLSNIGHHRTSNVMTSHLHEIPDNMHQINDSSSDKDNSGRLFMVDLSASQPPNRRLVVGRATSHQNSKGR